MEACQHGNAYMVARLLAAGADIAAQDTAVMPLYWFNCVHQLFMSISCVTAEHMMGDVHAHVPAHQCSLRLQLAVELSAGPYSTGICCSE